MASGNRNYLTIRGPGGNYYGYGRMFNSFKESLEDKVSLVDDASVVVDFMQPGMVKGWYEWQYRVLFTMWETDVLPYSMSEILDQFDQILVPSKHNYDLFSKHHKNVSVVPLGIDTGLWQARSKSPVKKPFKFLAGGSHWKRKGLDVVIEAFNRLEGDAELHLKCRQDIIGGIPPIDNPRIILHKQIMTPEEERDFYYGMNCFISMSRGEGWGLMPLQAIHAGIPTIISDTSGHKEFSEYAYRVIPTIPVPCDEPILYNVGNWDEPDIDALVEEMQTLLNQRSKPVLAGPTPYTWEYAAEQLLKAIPTGEKLNQKIWVQSDEATVKVQALRKIEADIGRHRIRLAKNEIAYIPVNAKTVLKENGAIIIL